MARALITGCSTGFGRATAVELKKRGYEVVATARRPETIADLGQALVDKNPLVRATAAKLLGGFTDPTVRRKLEPLLEDKSDAVRYMAAASIVRIERRSRR